MAFTKKSWQDHLTASFGQESETARASKDGLVIGGVYNAVAPTIADGEYSRGQVDASGNLMVNIAAGEEINIGTLNLGTITKIGSITNVGSITDMGTVKAVNTVGSNTGVGTVTNIGSLTNIGTAKEVTTVGSVTGAGTVAGVGTITNLGSVTNMGTVKGIDTFAGTAKTDMNTLISGEDQTNDVLKTEQQFSYYHHIGTAGSTTGTIKAAAGFLHSVVYNTHTAGGTYAIYDSAGTSATVIGIAAPGAALAPLTSIYDVKFTTGLTILSGSLCDLTVSYR